MKKTIAVLLALSLLAVCLPACGKSKVDSEKQYGNGVSEGTNDNSQLSETPAETSGEPADSDIIIVRSRMTGDKMKRGESAYHLEKWSVYYLSCDDILEYQDYYLYGSEEIASECLPYYSEDNGQRTGKIISTGKIEATSNSYYETREKLVTSVTESKTSEFVDGRDIQILYDNADVYVEEHLSPLTVKHNHISGKEEEMGAVEHYQVIYFDDYGVYSSHDWYTVFTDADAAQAYQNEYSGTAEGNVVYALGCKDHNPYGEHGYTKFGGMGVYDYCQRWYKDGLKADVEIIEGIVTPLD